MLAPTGAADAAAFFAMIFAGASAVTPILTVNHFDPPEVRRPAPRTKDSTLQSRLRLLMLSK